MYVGGFQRDFPLHNRVFLLLSITDPALLRVSGISLAQVKCEVLCLRFVGG